MKAEGLRAPMRPLFLASVLLLAGCSAPAPQDADVLATFYPLAWAAERLAGDNLTVSTLVPAGIEPHDWEPVPEDVARVERAKLIVAQGAGFEPWLAGLVRNLGERAPRVLDTTAEVALVEDEEHEGEPASGEAQREHYDPHTWLDPVLFAQQADRIERALVETFPAEGPTLRANGLALAAELDKLTTEYREGLAECETRVVIANHDAYSYLAARFGFRVVAISGLSPEAEPSPGAVAHAVEVARENNITIVFFEELVSPRVAEVVAKEVGARTRVLSPIESASGGADYLTLMRENLVGLREAMRCT